MRAGLLSPLALFTLAFIGGVFFGLLAAPTGWLAIGTLAVGCAVLLALARPRMAGVLLLAAFLAGSIQGTATLEGWRNDCRADLRDGAQLSVHGVLRDGWMAGDPSVRVTRATIDTGGGSACATGEVLVHPPRSVNRLDAGSLVTLTGTWRQYRFTDPLDGGRLRPPERSGGMRAATVVVERPGPAARARVDDRVRALYPEHADLVAAFALGQGRSVDPELRNRFARAGMAHLLAVSGLHVGLIAAGMLLLAAVVRLDRRQASLVTIAGVAAYVVVIGAPPSAVRAGTMIAVALLGRLLQRPFAPVPLVAFAALCMVALDPGVVLHLGFQLSFAGVLGILTGRELLLPALPEAVKRRGWPRVLTEGLLASGAAFLFTAPIAAWHFGLLAPVSVLSNLPASLVLAPVLFGIAASLILSPFAASIAGFLAGGVALLLDALVAWAEWMAALPGAYMYLAPHHVVSGLIAAACGGLLFVLGRGARPRVRLPASFAGVLVVVLMAGVVAPRTDGLELHFLDVGQGDATAIRTPADRWILVDAGPRMGEFDAGERRVVPYLRRRGAREIAALVLTHPHLDHIGGAAAVLRSFPVAAIVDPSQPVATPAYEEVLHLADSLGVRWIAGRTGRTIRIDGIELDILWPDGDLVDAAVDPNEISVVVRLRFGDFRALFTGDAYVAQEEVLVERHGAGLRSDVLQAGHHGSATSSGTPFLDAVGADLIVVSAGRGNRYGHPAPAALERMSAAGSPVARTDLEGTLVIRVPGNGSRGWIRARHPQPTRTRE